MRRVEWTGGAVGVAGGERLRQELQIVGFQQRLEFIAPPAEAGFDPGVTQRLDLRDHVGPIRFHTPEVTVQFQFHRCISIGPGWPAAGFVLLRITPPARGT